jgi:hypothetical protein
VHISDGKSPFVSDLILMRSVRFAGLIAPSVGMLDRMVSLHIARVANILAGAHLRLR